MADLTVALNESRRALLDLSTRNRLLAAGVNYAATPLIAVVILALLYLFVALKKNRT